jgi:hypothetical protein
MSLERDIYDFEGVGEDAFEADLNAVELVVVTSGTDPEFQRDRSRVEVYMKPGKWLGTLKPALGVASAPGSMRETSFDGHIRVTLITRADMEVHKNFRAAVRNRMSNCVPRLNKTLLTRHKLHSVETAGTEHDYASNEGRFESDLLFNVKFSIQDDALAALEGERTLQQSRQEIQVTYYLQCDAGGTFQLSASLVDGAALFSATGDNVPTREGEGVVTPVLLPNDTDGRYYEYRCADANTLRLNQTPSDEQSAAAVFFTLDGSVYQARCRTEQDVEGNKTIVPYLKLIA